MYPAESPSSTREKKFTCCELYELWLFNLFPVLFVKKFIWQASKLKHTCEDAEDKRNNMMAKPSSYYGGKGYSQRGNSI